MGPGVGGPGQVSSVLRGVESDAHSRTPFPPFLTSRCLECSSVTGLELSLGRAGRSASGKDHNVAHTVDAPRSAFVRC